MNNNTLTVLLLSLFLAAVLSLFLAAAAPQHSSKAEHHACDPSLDVSVGDGYHQYVCDSKTRHWVEDFAAEKQLHDMDARRASLYWALRTRVLTPEEEKEADSWGRSLNIETFPFQQDEKARELNDAWFQQRRLQRLTKLNCQTIAP